MIFIRERILQTANALFVGVAITDLGAWWFLSTPLSRIIGHALLVYGCAVVLYFQFHWDHVAVRLTERPTHCQGDHNGHSVP